MTVEPGDNVGEDPVLLRFVAPLAARPPVAPKTERRRGVTRRAEAGRQRAVATALLPETVVQADHGPDRAVLGGGQKTFLGYTYRGGPGTWEWIPPEGRDVELVALRRAITRHTRRC